MQTGVSARATDELLEGPVRGRVIMAPACLYDRSLLLSRHEVVTLRQMVKFSLRTFVECRLHFQHMHGSRVLLACVGTGVAAHQY